MGFVAHGGPTEEAKTSAQEVFNDVCLSTCYEAYRRKPLEPEREQPFGQAQLSRTGWARSLDLTHLLDVGRLILVGEAELDVPDGILVRGRMPKDTRRLVIFRQVIRVEPGGE